MIRSTRQRALRLHPMEDDSGSLAQGAPLGTRLRATVRSPAATLLCVLALLYTAYFTASLSIPIVAAVLLYFLLSPLVVTLVAWRVPRLLAAIVVVATLMGIVAGSLYGLVEPGSNWLREAPTSVADLRRKLTATRNPLEDVRNASDAVEDAVADVTGSGESDSNDAPSVQIREPGALDGLLGGLPVFLASSLVTVVLTLFLLIYGDRVLRSVVGLARSFGTRRRCVLVVRQVEHDIARYLGTIAGINVALGCVVAAAMYLVDLPNPILWGAVACVMNFAPYAGAVVTTLALFIAGVSAFDSLGAMFAPAAVFLGITTLEGQVFTPMVLGRRLELSPLVVLLSVLVVGWLWGLVGALMAVPIVTSVRILLSNVPRLRPFAMMLGK